MFASFSDGAESNQRRLGSGLRDDFRKDHARQLWL